MVQEFSKLKKIWSEQATIWQCEIWMEVFFDHTKKSRRVPWGRCHDFEYPITCDENLAAGQLQCKQLLKI
jgi:hypothetical protein